MTSRRLSLGLSAILAGPPPPRAVHLYFSVARDRLIFASMRWDSAGVYSEEPAPIMLDRWPSKIDLGAQFRVALAASNVLDPKLPEKSTFESPARLASRSRSTAECGGPCRLVRCYGTNSSNAVIRASTPYFSDADVELSVSFKLVLSDETIGEMLTRLIDIAIAT
jgi:hypothetical protein